jgi:iron complex transport system ATP-binding protein
MDIRNLSFSYRHHEKTINHINAAIRPGTITTIIGPNGSGKSTLLSLLANRLTPIKGEVVVDGKTLSSYRAKELARHLAVVYQQNEAPADITVKKLVAYGRFPYRKRFSNWKEEDELAVNEALEATKLENKAHLPLLSLSGGEQQRAWIALALAQKTNILLLDEPTTYLDLYHQLEVLELVRSLNRLKKTTIVMVLHDLNQAIQYSDELIVMQAGSIVKAGLPKEVVTEEMVENIYGVRAVLRDDAEAGLVLLPVGI